MDGAAHARVRALIGAAKSRLTIFYVRKGWGGKILLGLILVALLFGVGLQPQFVQAKPKAAQDLYVASLGTNSVIRYDGATGALIGTFVSSGSGAALLQGAWGVTFGPDGNLYVTAWQGNQVKRYNGTDGAFIDNFVNGNGLNNPHGLTFGPDGNLYVANFGDNTIRRYNGTTGASMGVFVAASPNGPNQPEGLRFGPTGDLYVASRESNEVRRYNGTTGAFVSVFASGNGLARPNDVIFDSGGNLLVSNNDTNQILRFNSSGTFLGVFVTTGSGGLSEPHGIVFGPDGNLYVASHGNNQILRYNGTTGAFISPAFVSAGLGGLQFPKFITFSPPSACIITTVTITSHTPNPVTLGQSITVSFSVTSGGGTPNAGTVLVSDGSASCTGNVSVSGTGSCTLTPTSAGAKTLIATYSGDGVNWCSSASTGVAHTVQAPSCTTTVTSSINPSTVGQAVTFTASVSSSTCAVAGTTVTFRDGSTTLCTATLNSSGQATCTTSALTVGSHNITTVWNGGQSCNATCTSANLAQVVNAVGSAPSEVPEADTLLLFAGGGSAFATWLGWQWRKVRRKN